MTDTRIRNYLLIAGAVFVAFLFVMVIGALVTVFRPADTHRTTLYGSETPVVLPEPEPTASITPPSAKDFVLELKTVSKQCYGAPIGCAIEVRVEIVSGPTLPAGADFRLTYEIVGVENGPRISSLKLTGETGFTGTPDQVYTKDGDTKISVKPVAVI